MTAFDLAAALTKAQADYLQNIAGIITQAGGALPPVEPADTTAWTPIPSTSPPISLLGSTWSVQSGTPDGICIGPNNQLKFRAVGGDRASFDQPRKIRAELTSNAKFQKGDMIPFKGKIIVSSDTMIWNTEWCTIFQAHQFDTKGSTGAPIASSPMFSLNLYMYNGKPRLQVNAPTQLGKPQANVFPPPRVLADVPFAFGQEHDFGLRVVDGHGYDGSVWVSLDGQTIADFVGPTGFEYVDLQAGDWLNNGKPQEAYTYPKVGIYAGKGTGSVPPPDTFVSYRYTLLP